MLSEILLNFEKIKKEDIDKEILRAGIIADLEVIKLYEHMATLTGNKDIKKILLDIVKEEKMHVAKFHALLLREYKEMEKELEKGRKRIEEIFSAYKAGAKLQDEQKAVRPTSPTPEVEKPREQKEVKSARHTPEAEKPRVIPSSEVKDTKKSGKDLETGRMHVCPICGYKAIDTVPHKCPICGAPGEKFKNG